MCVECYMCLSCCLDWKTDRLFLWVCGGWCRGREIVARFMLSLWRSGGPRLSLTSSYSLLLFGTLFSFASLLPFFFHSFLSNALQTKRTPSHQPCASSQSSKKKCQDVFTLLIFSFLWKRESFTNWLCFAVLDVQCRGHVVRFHFFALNWVSLQCCFLVMYSNKNDLG